MENRQLDYSAHTPSAKKYPLCLLAHDMHVPMNVGSLFRIADAFGAERIYLTGTSLVPPNPKIKKTSRSTEKYVPFEYASDPVGVVSRLRQHGYRIVCLEITNKSIHIKNLKIKGGEKICLILGSEDKGIAEELLNTADETVHIPMLGINSSMNVASACAIALYEITRRFDGEQEANH